MEENGMEENSAPRDPQNPQNMDEEVVVAQPGVGIEMGRFPESTWCPWCGFEVETRIDYWHGAKSACCCICIGGWLAWFGTGAYMNFGVAIGWLAHMGIPGCFKVSCFDVQHYCTNCMRKIGYNRQSEKCCCWNSTETKRMPQN